MCKLLGFCSLLYASLLPACAPNLTTQAGGGDGGAGSGGGCQEGVKDGSEADIDCGGRIAEHVPQEKHA